MKDWLYHVIVGNETHPQLVAAARGLLLALTAGASAGLSAWTQTDVPKEIFIPAASAFLVVFVARVLGEGAIDTWKYNGRDKR